MHALSLALVLVLSLVVSCGKSGEAPSPISTAQVQEAYDAYKRVSAARGLPPPAGAGVLGIANSRLAIADRSIVDALKKHESVKALGDSPFEVVRHRGIDERFRMFVGFFASRGERLHGATFEIVARVENGRVKSHSVTAVRFDLRKAELTDTPQREVIRDGAEPKGFAPRLE